ncbi:MAG: zinc ribbon domain-containing protein [Anaerolineales bacterium]|jgi:putative FmdB family regulatory protein
MPTYTYRCGSCGVQFDRKQKFSDKALVRCPECGQPTLHKLIQPVGIVFKGSGFYATDHRSPSGRTSPPTHSKDDKKEETSKKPESSDED